MQSNEPVNYQVMNLTTTVVMILIFTLIDMLSCGPIMFYTSKAEKLAKNFTDEKSISTLKTLGILCYIYSTIISMFTFNIFSGIETTIISGIITESLQMMVTSYSDSILEEVHDVNAYFTNFFAHLIITSLAFGCLSLIIKLTNCAHMLSLVPKAIVNGCLGAIGICQVFVGYECLVPNGVFTKDLIPLMIIAVVVLVIFLLIEMKYQNFDFLIPVYSFFLIVIFYLISFIFVKDQNKIEYLRKKNWLSNTEPVIYPNFILQRLEPSSISLKAIGKNFFSIMSVVLMDSVHIVVNLPAFRMATGVDFDFSKELATQGFSNFFTLIPCYFIASYSITCTNSGGNKRIYGIIAGAFLIIIALYGAMIKAYIPKFILSLVPFIVFYGFFSASFIQTFKKISLLEYFISILVCITCILTNIYVLGMIVGFIVYILSFLLMSKKSINKEFQNLKKESESNIVRVDYILWFLTLEKFVIPDQNETLFLDFTNCKGIDWLGADLIENACKKAQKVIFIGEPFNFCKHRFSRTANFFIFKNYQAYIESGIEV